MSCTQEMGAAKLEEMGNAVVMLRSSLLRDFTKKGLRIGTQDAWVFSMWSGYLKAPEYQHVRSVFEAAGPHADPHERSPRYLTTTSSAPCSNSVYESLRRGRLR